MKEFIRVGDREDALKHLWAPWRIEYILSPDKEPGCLFCRCLGEDDDKKNLVLLRDELCFSMFNRYPYNNGHLMIVPNSHCSRLSDLSEEELVAMMQMTQKLEALLEQEMNPDGFNVGFNLGRPAGAGIKDHLHMHIVPRWNGDTNFMSVLDDMRVVPESLEKLHDSLSRTLGSEEEA